MKYKQWMPALLIPAMLMLSACGTEPSPATAPPAEPASGSEVQIKTGEPDDNVDNDDDDYLSWYFFGDDEEARLRREEELSDYLAAHPDLADAAGMLKQSYYIDLSAYTPVLSDDDFFEDYIELYKNSTLRIEQGILCHSFIFERLEGGGNNFQKLVEQLASTPYLDVLEGEISYQISLDDDEGRSIGVAYAILEEGQLSLMPWDGTNFNSYTLKISAELMQALAESTLDLSRVKAVLISFAGHYGAVLHDGVNVFFTPVMGEGGISDCGLEVGLLYSLEETIGVFEQAFES